MKNFHALLALSLCLGFVACGDDDEPASSPTADVVADAGQTDAGTTDTVTTPDADPEPDTATDTAVVEDVPGPPKPMTILEAAQAYEDQFSTLLTAVELAGLSETLNSEGTYTVFAPTNDAFGTLDEDTLNAALADPDGLLKAVVLYHTLGTVEMSTDVAAATSLTTLNGADIAVSLDGDAVKLNGTVGLTMIDLECTNGVIHVIDGVLLPPSEPEPEPVPTTYTFEGVSHSGQTMRHALIGDLKAWIGNLTTEIDGGVFAPTSAQEVLDEIAFYVEFDHESDGETAIGVSVAEGLELAEKTYGELGTANLQKKIAGNDTKTDFKDWATEFKGWDGVTSPDALLDFWFGLLADNAVARANGELDWDVHLTAAGHDLQQLIQKFLTMSITFHQGADDYLDDDVDGKGLKASNILEDGAAYTGLAHAWDEGFGYFGSAKNYADYTDEEIAKKGGKADWQGYHDTNGDGLIQLKDEYNWGGCVNAAKRDRGSQETAKTDFTGDIFTALVAGRHLIATAGGDLSDDQMAELKGYRDTVVWGWEKAFAATAVHYINDTLGDMAKFGTEEYSFATHAKHWGELKGFALGFQFSPHSPLSDADFADFHAKVGDAPVLEDAGDDAIAAYKTALEEAAAILGEAYGFADENVANW
ncbi:MAG: DUF4856 domain-containing protein [Deltaproteobacteria bacterium]|nr:DUF4856 domain-containing protein [Deltaproteobacteria bacterium]